MTDDRDALIDRTADGIEAAFARGLATPEGRAAYADLTRDGGTLSINGREISPETGEVSRDRDDGDDDGDANPEAGRERRVAGLVWDADPDERVYPPDYETLYLGEPGTITRRSVDLPFAESPFLARVGAALIARDERNLANLDRWGIRIAYLWADDLGKEGGEPRLWRIKKAGNDLVWALGQARERRVVDLLVFVNARIARFAEFTNWQIQAALHTALGHARVRQGKLAVEPPSAVWQRHLIRRYGRWTPDMRALAEVLRLAEADQLALWDDDRDQESE